jgi:type IV pilus assembly protein PilV
MNKHHHSVLATSRQVRSFHIAGSHKKASGFSLVEILISIIVLSFGLLGMVGLQAAALQANRDSRIQSSAVRLARELGELMRSNKEIGTKEIGTATTPATNPYLIYYASPDTIPSTVTADITNCFTGDCTTATKLNIAKFEVLDWLTRLNKELPGAKVKVCFDATPFDASGTPQWDCSDSGGVAIIKIGWTKASTNRSKTFDKATVPSVILPVTAGSTT